MAQRKSCVLLVNTGSPDKPTPKAVFRYLMQFLLDPRVVDVPPVVRHILVGGFIVPRRYRTSAKNYKSIWTEEGSPLIATTQKLKSRLALLLGEDVIVEACMRYGSPSISQTLEHIKTANVKKLIILPLFPQYASATSGSVLEAALSCIKKWKNIPDIVCISDFVHSPGFLQSWIDVAKPYDFSSYDRIVFTFHGLPKRQLKKGCTGCSFAQDNKPLYDCGKCYPNQCHYLTNALINALSINKMKTSLCFQSRLGQDEWLGPYTQDVIVKLAQQGAKRVCLFAPSFVSDCLETLYELGIEYRDEFIKHGGEHLELIPSLNVHPTWIKALQGIINANFG